MGHAVSYDADSFVAQLQALLPPGAVWTRDPDSDLTSLLRGAAQELARVQGRAEDLLREMDPAQAVELLDVHESNNGLPDPCYEAPTLLADRRAVLLARLADSRGHNGADYKSLASSYGHITTSVYPATDRAFRAGRSRAGEPANSDSVAYWYVVAYMLDLVSFIPTFGVGEWTLSSAAVDSTSKFAPYSSVQDAVQLTFGSPGFGGAIVSTQLGAAGTPKHFQISFWIKRISGQESVSVSGFLVGGGFIDESVSIEGDSWARHELRFESEAGFAAVAIGSSDETTIDLWGTCLSAVDNAFECALDSVQLSIGQPRFRTINDANNQVVAESNTLSSLASFGVADYYASSETISLSSSGWTISLLFKPESSMDSGSPQALFSAENQASDLGMYVWSQSGQIAVGLVRPGADVLFAATGGAADDLSDFYGQIMQLFIWHDGSNVYASINGAASVQLNETFSGGDLTARIGVREGGGTPLAESILGATLGSVQPNQADLASVYARSVAERSIQPMHRTDHRWDFTRMFKASEEVQDTAHVERVSLVRVGDGPSVSGISISQEFWS